MSRLCFVDIESTGLEADRHEVYEIGLIVRDGDSRMDPEWRWWLPVNLTRADPNALRVGRFFERRPPQNHTWSGALQWAPDISGKIEQADVRDVAASVMELTAGAHLVGAVPSFDAAFLSRLLRAHGCCPAWNYHLVDVEALAAGLTQTEPPWDSGKLFSKLGVDPDQFDRHTALGDARLAKATYDFVMGNIQ